MGEEFGLPAPLLFVGLGARSGVGGKRAPFRRERRPCSVCRSTEGFARPLPKGFAKQRQIEQPFTGIIDDVDGKRLVPGPPADFWVEYEAQPQLGNAPCRLRPMAFAG